VATIVGLVEAKGTLSRSELVDAMGSATFMHRKARPQNQGWCQGYIAGAIRGGFLKIADAEPTTPITAS
jgi:metal-responsive CopG/Arc/MetJ family transcriptional regulator